MSEIWNLEIWKPGNLGPENLGIWDPTNPKKNNILKMKIRVAQNVGKVWISSKKSSWPHFMPFQAWAGKMGDFFLPIFFGGTMDLARVP